MIYRFSGSYTLFKDLLQQVGTVTKLFYNTVNGNEVTNIVVLFEDTKTAVNAFLSPPPTPTTVTSDFPSAILSAVDSVTT